jgi:hypothetical protein
LEVVGGIPIAAVLGKIGFRAFGQPGTDLGEWAWCALLLCDTVGVQAISE